ncbi:MAG: T9SS type A sorting domain-containing protein [Bacteroidales bacterium]|nr:T9SS type A sorting domain-containing protein [Bacteroidales bacterium]
MKKISFFLIFILNLNIFLWITGNSLLFITVTYADKGGPDKFGYTWKDSNEPDGPKFQWYEIPLTTDRVVKGLGDDNVLGPYPIGGKFIFYWYPVEKFWVGSNGYIAFRNIHIAAPFPNIPDSTDKKTNFIAPFLSDLSYAEKNNPGKCVYASNKDSLIISFINVPFWSQIYGYSGTNTFQIILNKTDRSITFNYKKMQGETISSTGFGIENQGGNMGLGQRFSKQPIANYCIKYYYPQNPTYIITDASSRWNGSDGSKGWFTTIGNKDISLVSNFANLGNQPIDTFKLSCRLADPLGKNVIYEKLAINSIFQPSIDTTVVFSSKFSPALSGCYTFCSGISGVEADKYNTNDSVMQEIIAVDTSQSIVNLSYYRNFDLYQGQSWIGNDGGVGVYIKPPFYPVKIVSTNFIIQSNSNSAGFYSKIYDDSGTNGTVGKLLDSVYVPPSSIDILHTTTVPVKNEIVLYSGGVYIAWIMKGENITIGIDNTPPFSNQTYEVLSGTWAQFRDYENQDFCISLNVKKHYIEDLSVKSIITPKQADIIKKPVDITCRIINKGEGPASNFSLYYNLDYTKDIIETYKGNPIAAGDSIDYTFNTKLYTELDSVIGYLCVGVKMFNDFRHNNDSSCSFLKIYNTSGLNFNQRIKDIKILQDPLTSQIFIEFDKTKQCLYNIQILDLKGIILFKQTKIDKEKISINTINLQTGLYIITISSQENMPSPKPVLYNAKLLIY